MSKIHVPYWLVGDKKIYTQFEANREAFVEKGPAYRLVFLEDSYDTLDWQQEPDESWEQLCLERALYLRSKWKKLKLCFSAGRDSGFILRLFEKHKILIDELMLPYATPWPLRVTEHFTYVKPTAEAACRRNPGMSMREIPLGPEYYNELYGQPDWLTGKDGNQRNMLFVPYNWKKIVETDPDHSSGTTGYMFGVEKPHIRLIDGKFYFQINDANIQNFTQNINSAEWFFWAPEQPRLFLKQCWMLVNYFESRYPGCSSEFVANFQRWSSGHYDEFCRAVGLGDPISIGVGLAQSKMRNNYHWSLQKTMETARDQGWKGYKEWVLTIEDLRKNYSHFFNEGDPMKGTIGIWGKPYFMKDQNVIGAGLITA